VKDTVDVDLGRGKTSPMSAGAKRHLAWWQRAIGLLVVAMGPVSGVLLGLGAARHSDALLTPGAIMLGLLFIGTTLVLPVIRIRLARRRR
jgi:hypothetical protein